MTSKLRNLKNLLQKVNRGFRFRDKLFVLLNCLEIEHPRLRGFCSSVKAFIWSGAKIKLDIQHGFVEKVCHLTIRSRNHADAVVLGEFLSGGLYYDPPRGADLIVDCGANLGLFAVHAGLLFPDARIICYEPEADNFGMLVLNLEANGIAADCRNCGVWSCSISGFFHSAASFNGHVSLEPSNFPIRCELPQTAEGCWLKMDVEGAEYEVLPAILTNGARPRLIVMEVHDYHRRGRDIRDQLSAAGYIFKAVTDGSATPESAILSAEYSLRKEHGLSNAMILLKR